MANTYKQSFKQSEPENAGISVYNCGLQSCEKGYTWGPGVRDHYLIHLVTSGSGSYSVNGQQHAIRAGDLFLARPSQRITYTADTANPWEYYWVGFNGVAAGQMVQQLPFTDEAPYCRCNRPEQSRDLLHSIYQARGLQPSNCTRMAGFLYLFIAGLMEESEEASVSRQPDTGSQYVINAVKFIQFNYSHNIGVDDIAKAVGVSRSHLYRVFMNVVGKSPIDYLTDFRIGEACSLLENTMLSIAEVAYSTGFFDQFYFSRVFKKIKGVPPSKYIESKRANLEPV